MLAALELAEPGGLLDELAPLLRLRSEHGFDLSLADDRVHRAGKADVGEQLDEVGAANVRAVDEVLALPTPVQAPRDRHFREVEPGSIQRGTKAAVLVVEDELDLAGLGRLAALGAVEEDVVRLVRAQLGRRQRARRPDDRVGDVRLAGAVRADDDRYAGLQLQLERVRKRLEAAQSERAQVHGTRLAREKDGVPSCEGHSAS